MEQEAISGQRKRLNQMNYDFDERISNKKWNCNIWNKADSRKDENLETIRMFFIRNCDSPKIKDDRIKNHRLKQVDSSLFLALAQIRMNRPKTAAPGLETPSNRSSCTETPSNRSARVWTKLSPRQPLQDQPGDDADGCTAGDAGEDEHREVGEHFKIRY